MLLNWPLVFAELSNILNTNSSYSTLKTDALGRERAVLYLCLVQASEKSLGEFPQRRPAKQQLVHCLDCRFFYVSHVAARPRTDELHKVPAN